MLLLLNLSNGNAHLIRTVLLAALFAATADASAVEMTDLTKCRAVTDVPARAECYDSIVDTAVKQGKKTIEQPVASKPAPPPKEKTVALSKATRAGTGRLILVTTEGEVWSQTEGEPLPKVPEAGASMTIKRGAMGGSFCSLDSHASFRCSLRNN